MGRVRFAVATAAALAAGVLVGPAVAGAQSVDVITVSAAPLHAFVWHPGAVPALGVDALELGPGRAEGGDAAAPSGAPQAPQGDWTDRSKTRQKEHDDEENNH